MGTNCAPLVVDLFLLCYERDFMKPLSRENQTDIIEGFSSTSRYLDDLLNIWQYFALTNGGPHIPYRTPNSYDTEVPILDLNLCISNGTVSSKIYDKMDDFDFDIVNFPFLDGDVPRRPHMGYTYLNLLNSPELLQILMTLTIVSSCGHGTKAVIQNHKSINEWRIRMFRPTDMDPRTKGVIRRPRIVSITW